MCLSVSSPICPNNLTYSTNPFRIIEPQDQEIGKLYFIQERREDFEDQKL